MTALAHARPSPGCPIDAWCAARRAAPGLLDGYRLFAPPWSALVPVAGRGHPVLQVHVPLGAAAGHHALLARIARRSLIGPVLLLEGTGVAAHLVAPDGTRRWVPTPEPGLRLVPAGEAGTTAPTLGVVLRFATVAHAAAAWDLLDRIGDELYGQEVLDRTLHLPPGTTPPAGARPAAEHHVRADDGRRLVHLDVTGTMAAAARAWLPARPGRCDLYHWLRWRPGASA